MATLGQLVGIRNRSVDQVYRNHEPYRVSLETAGKIWTHDIFSGDSLRMTAPHRIVHTTSLHVRVIPCKHAEWYA